MQDFIFYLKLGWEHIISLDALDHQLFILVLIAVYFYKDWRKILILITAFTIGHSVTLALSVFEVFRLPSNLVEILIPITIILTALDNILFRGDQRKLMRINYFFALFFGLIHGMGFANTARMAMASEQNIAAPLLGFNIGLELGQITVVLLVMGLLYLLSKYLKFQQKYWMIGISVIAIVLSAQMVFERF
jgi:hypothetical protein